MNYLISSGLFWPIAISLALTGIYIVGAFIFLGSSGKSKKEPPRSEQPQKKVRPIPGSSYVYTQEWQYDYSAPRRSREEIMKEEFWHDAHSIALDYIQRNDIDSLTEFVYNIWTTRDKEESAEDLHYFFNSIIYYFYPCRHYSDKHYELINIICDLDISNVENLAKSKCQKTPHIVASSFTKKAVMLEKEGRIEDAIRVCDCALAYNVADYGYFEGGFTARKAKLLKKVKVRSIDENDLNF